MSPWGEGLSAPSLSHGNMNEYEMSYSTIALSGGVILDSSKE